MGKTEENQDSCALIEDPERLSYVKKLARRYYGIVPYDKRGLITLDDLVSAGYEGLTVAAGRYRPGTGAKFRTYSVKWIRGEMIRELIFYLGKDALLFDDETVQAAVSDDKGPEALVSDGMDISAIPEDEQVRIIRSKLKAYSLTKDEITVYLAVNGIGCRKVTNLRVLAGQLGRREMEIRRIRQSAEGKVKKALGQGREK